MRQPGRRSMTIYNHLWGAPTLLKDIIGIGSKNGLEAKALLDDERERVDFLNELKNDNLPPIDMRRIWTHHYPKMFEFKPKVVDWSNERMLKDKSSVWDKKIKYFVIPRYNKSNKTLEELLNNFSEKRFKQKFVCDNCTEIVFRK